MNTQRKSGQPETIHRFVMNIGTTLPEQLQTLQKIKDAMVHAVFTQIETDGIEKDNRHFSIWQTLYLEADYQAGQIGGEHVFM